jgi:hypothetical protein
MVALNQEENGAKWHESDRIPQIFWGLILGQPTRKMVDFLIDIAHAKVKCFLVRLIITNTGMVIRQRFLETQLYPADVLIGRW